MSNYPAVKFTSLFFLAILFFVSGMLWQGHSFLSVNTPMFSQSDLPEGLAMDTFAASVEEVKSPSKAARNAFIFNMLRSPLTNTIPPAIRSRELAHARQVTKTTRSPGKTRTFNWFEVGPFDVGGRTRALAIDLENSNRLLAGGVSGGLWESTDRGASWHPLDQNENNLSVTYLTQDPRPGERNTWYYASGEFFGNSASDANRNAPYYGRGLYKSTDNGDSWFSLPAANAGIENIFDSPFDYVNRLAVSPVTGTLFVASNAFGIFRSSDGGDSFGTIRPGRRFPDPSLGGINDHFWSDVAVNSNGVVLAAISSLGSDNQSTFDPGIYASMDDGVSWSDITPGSFPAVHGRSVIAFAPSNPSIAYIFTTTNTSSNDSEDVRLHKINVSTRNSEELTDNLTPLSEAGNIDTQAGYNMAIAVKPDDENFVLLGATNVYRSRNGFSSGLVDRLDYWIGGYDAVDDDFGNYQNHHPDQHLFIFETDNPDRMWNATDGGVYMTNNISASNEVTWFDMNSGYNTTQFYTVAIPSGANDPRIAGGAQDNGTPFIRLDDLGTTSRNISVGDGSRLYFGDAYVFVGFQNGATLRLQYTDEGNPTFAGFSFIQPSQASNQLFVTPFEVDPNNEEIMYYAAGASVWRNSELSSLPSGQTDNGGLTAGWNRLPNIPQIGSRNITALSVSRNPSHVLYYGTSDTQADPGQSPRLYRLPDADISDGGGARLLSLPSIPGGAYVSDIAINPLDADEILVVFSNYDIVGLYHSVNGGDSFTAVEGNLIGTNDLPGPSLRAATIQVVDNEPQYFVGTSTGLYSTSQLNGAGTEWSPEGNDEIGQAVVWDVTSRPSDHLIAVGTHGRGLFVGSQDPNFDPRPIPDSYSLSQNYPNPFASISRIGYNLPENSRVSLAVYDLSGRKVADLVSNREQETGRHEAVFNASTLASGVYLYQLLASPISGSNGASFSQTKKMMVIK